MQVCCYRERIPCDDDVLESPQLPHRPEKPSLVLYEIESKVEFLKVREHHVWLRANNELFSMELGELVSSEVELT